MQSMVMWLKAVISSCSLRSAPLAIGVGRPKLNAAAARLASVHRWLHTIDDNDQYHKKTDDSDKKSLNAKIKKNIDAEADDLHRTIIRDVPKVMVIGMNNNHLGLMSLIEARHLAKHKDLKLVQQLQTPAQEARSGHLVYKLITGAQLQEERQKERESRLKAKAASTSTSTSGALITKGVRTLIVGGRIAKHDLQIKMKTVQRWLLAGYSVRATINGDRNATSNMEEIFSELEKAADEVGGQVLQKRRDDEAFNIKFTVQMSKKKVAAMKQKQAATDDTT